MENKLNVVFTNVSAFYIIVLKLTCNSDLSRSASIKTLSTCPIFKREILKHNFRENERILEASIML